MTQKRLIDLQLLKPYSYFKEKVVKEFAWAVEKNL